MLIINPTEKGENGQAVSELECMKAGRVVAVAVLSDFNSSRYSYR